VKVLVNAAIGMTQRSVEEANANGLRLALFRRSSSVHKVNSFKNMKHTCSYSAGSLVLADSSRKEYTVLGEIRGRIEKMRPFVIRYIVSG
jgi:hypothetical protein